MIKKIFIFSLLLTCLMVTNAYAAPMTLTLESYDPAMFPTVSTIIDVPDINDQLGISIQATYFALSEDGWNMQNMGINTDRSRMLYVDFNAILWTVAVQVSPSNPTEYDDLFGYSLNPEALDPEALTYGAGYYFLAFHTDAWSERLLHEVGESQNNFGVISGLMGGDWTQCPVPDWGRYYVEPVSTVPAPPTVYLLSVGLIGVGIIRRRLNL